MRYSVIHMKIENQTSAPGLSQQNYLHALPLQSEENLLLLLGLLPVGGILLDADFRFK